VTDSNIENDSAEFSELADPQVDSVPEENAAPARPRRRRRTKAQMAAARSAEAVAKARSAEAVAKAAKESAANAKACTAVQEQVPFGIMPNIADLPNLDDRPSVFADLANILITDGEDGFGDEQFTSTVRFGKPNDQTYVRCRPGDDRKANVWCVKDKNSMGKIYVVHKRMLPQLGPHCKRFVLREAITSNKISIVWPAPLNSGNRENPSGDAHRRVQDQSEHEWVRLWWDEERNTFQGNRPLVDLGDPEWPDKSFAMLIEEALKGNIIDSEDHPVYRRIVAGR
jgi:hypothetical protein